MGVNVLRLDRRLQFLRAVMGDDGYGNVITGWAAHGVPVWGARKDVSDAEQVAAGRLLATVTARFIIRRSSFAAGLTPMDQFTCDGATWAIDGIKEVAQPRRGFLEITATKGAA
ncbi:phage head closure protein [Phaeovulum vinaykumarii]|uniref:Phage head-tail adaptor, putative, SPP1 family n=1 Tax=Phaeovulum vinaykumarii TaxID=407234 RepID=A0A1N7N4X9_9RHOB|nr:phage head closure protein [Phaeovulum vinaykumarii]SIS93405.1 phage head-tail adaptor, putative, SPP1 family [Phaeovulum vinaykumarii]SOC19769.1 SPP1 family predicted phage head-tail adaptor [Phaeovulum vinaykumarii]